jgi:hypothetical protein
MLAVAIVATVAITAIVVAIVAIAVVSVSVVDITSRRVIVCWERLPWIARYSLRSSQCGSTSLYAFIQPS